MLTEIDINTLHRRIFRLAPQVLALSQEHGMDMLHAFLSWAEQQHIPMDWTTHIYFLTWLKQQEKWQMNAECVQELLIAAAVRWSLSGLDHIAARGIAISSTYLPGQAIALVKSDAPEKPAKIVILQGTFPIDAYALSYRVDDWNEMVWLSYNHAN